MTMINDPKTQAGQEIIEGLAVSLKLCQDLLSTLHEEGVALRTMDTQGLFRLSRQKDTLLTKIHYLDDSLQLSLTKQQKATPPPDLTSEQSQLVEQYKGKIKQTRQEIQARNMTNKRFTEDTLGYLKDAIALFTDSSEANNTYCIPGRSLARGKSTPSYISRGV